MDIPVVTPATPAHLVGLGRLFESSTWPAATSFPDLEGHSTAGPATVDGLQLWADANDLLGTGGAWPAATSFPDLG
jgi:hypothetical protein